MIKHSPLILFFSLLFLSSLACGETAATPIPPTLAPIGSVAPKGERILSIDITEAQGEAYETSFALAQSLGMEDASLTVFWDELETAPGVFDPDPNWLAIANLFYSAQDTAVSLTISVIDTNNLRLPPDLADKSFDDPVVIERFNQLLDYVFSQIPDLELTTLAIGNEIDGFLGANEADWQAYETFFATTAVHARTLRPNLLIGSKGMFDGITGYAADHFQSLNQHSDVVLVTYYPLNSDFTVRQPATVHADFQTIVDVYPDKPIYFLELGYPSGAANDSSERQQAAFVQQVFQAWDDHATHIKLLSFTWLTDIPPGAVDEFTDYYELNNEAFASYLGTLGLRAHDGTAKEAFRILQAEAEARGW